MAQRCTQPWLIPLLVKKEYNWTIFISEIFWEAVLKNLLAILVFLCAISIIMNEKRPFVRYVKTIK